MRTFNEIGAAARDKPAFSNGTEGDAWTSKWCGRCAHDLAMRVDGAPSPDPGSGILGCPILAVSVLQKTPAEWFEQPWGEHGPRLGDRYHCVEYRHEDDGPSAGPQPLPDPPGQGVLWGREPFEGTRMLTATPSDEMAGVG